MTQKKYDVFLEGKIKENQDVESVKNSIAKLFKLDKKKADKLFAGKRKAIKKNLDLKTAEKYKEKIEKAGALCSIDEVIDEFLEIEIEIEDEGVPGEAPAEVVNGGMDESVEIIIEDDVEDDIEDGDEEVLEIDDGNEIGNISGNINMDKGDQVKTFACPKCGFVQDKALECVSCGILFSKFKKKGDAPPEGEVVKYPGDDGYESDVPLPGVTVYDEDSYDGLSEKEIKIKNIAFVIFLAAVILTCLAGFFKDRYPAVEDVYKPVFKNPKQSTTRRNPFNAYVDGKKYVIVPQFDYELNGLVVSYYDATGWWDLTHRFFWKDTLNLKDICVAYGDTVASGAYLGMSFKSGSWTCWSSFDKKWAMRNFCGSCISNNHLLAEDKEIQQQILRVRKGDQIYLKGYLASYSHSGGSRGTSVTRYDEGNGACETIYVTEFNIIQTANRTARFLFTLGAFVVFGSLCVVIFFVVKDVYLSTSDKTMGKEWRGGDKKNDAGAIAKLIIIARDLTGGDMGFKVKVVGRLLLLLFLLYLWYSLH